MILDQSNGTLPEWYYIGELKDEEPDGFGRLYRIRNLGSDIDPEYVYQKVYIGEFKKGRYSGYGREYDYFHEGKYEGKGNLFRGPGYYYVIHYATSKNDVDIISDAIKEYQEIIVGEYKRGDKEGEFKEYSQGRLLFEGTYKNDLRNGEGTLFDTQGNIVCSGEKRANMEARPLNCWPFK